MSRIFGRIFNRTFCLPFSGPLSRDRDLCQGQCIPCRTNSPGFTTGWFAGCSCWLQTLSARRENNLFTGHGVLAHYRCFMFIALYYTVWHLIYISFIIIHIKSCAWTNTPYYRPKTIGLISIACNKVIEIKALSKRHVLAVVEFRRAMCFLPWRTADL